MIAHPASTKDPNSKMRHKMCRSFSGAGAVPLILRPEPNTIFYSCQMSLALSRVSYEIHYESYEMPVCWQIFKKCCLLENLKDYPGSVTMNNALHKFVLIIQSNGIQPLDLHVQRQFKMQQVNKFIVLMPFYINEILSNPW